MVQATCQAAEICDKIVRHLIAQIKQTPAIDEPFSHIYLENVLPHDIYDRAINHLPDPNLYEGSAERHHGKGEAAYTRQAFPLTTRHLERLAPEQQDLYRGLAAALTDPEVKRTLFTKLSRDLAYRFGIPAAHIGAMPAYARPSLFRETQGFEIAPHPDTRKKIVTMHLYWPHDKSQLDLGTALYRRKLLAWPFGSWHHRFEKVKQFLFQPNSGYAFVVNNTVAKKSWHGRETLPPGAGVRNTLLNTFFGEARSEYTGYLESKVAHAA